MIGLKILFEISVENISSFTSTYYLLVVNDFLLT